jgi:hypothetical protein
MEFSFQEGYGNKLINRSGFKGSKVQRFRVQGSGFRVQDYTIHYFQDYKHVRKYQNFPL